MKSLATILLIVCSLNLSTLFSSFSLLSIRCGDTLLWSDKLLLVFWLKPGDCFCKLNYPSCSNLVNTYVRIPRDSQLLSSIAFIWLKLGVWTTWRFLPMRRRLSLCEGMASPVSFRELDSWSISFCSSVRQWRSPVPPLSLFKSLIIMGLLV